MDVASRLTAARLRHFVGRIAEMELFRSAIGEGTFSVLYLFGPGGVGKTALLHRLAQIAAESGAQVVAVDARNLDPSPEAFLQSLRQAMGLPGTSSPQRALAALSRSVLAIDTYETLTPLDGWLRETFLPSLTDRSLVVLVGRNPPSTAWLSDPGWHDLLRTVSLRNLRPEESRDYLTRREVPAHLHPQVLELTHGHPLALSLVADLLKQSASTVAFSLADAPQIVRTLLDRFVQQVPDIRQSQALEACATLRVTTEAALGAALGQAEVSDLFRWLRELSFIEHGTEGLFPHDLAREALAADLRWRNPDQCAALHRRLRQYHVRRIQETQGTAQQRAFFDLVFLHRQSPFMRPYFQWRAVGSLYAEPARAVDFPAILDLTARHEGPEAARLAEHWLARQPEAFTIFRSAAGESAGYMAYLALHRASAEELSGDPVARAAWEYAQRHSPTRSDEEVQMLRFWMDGQAYQQVSASQNLVAAVTTAEWITNPRLAWCYMTCADPDLWHPIWSYIDLHRAEEAECEVGGRRHAVYAHDWRARPVSAWVDLLGERELATDLRLSELESPGPAPLVVLSQPDFAQAVRQALRDYTRPAALASSPLLRSRLVVEAADGLPGPETLRGLIQTAVESLRSGPRDEKLYRALNRTYLIPAPTQEAAAELLGLPYRTYRRHLLTGIERVTNWLWQRELYGADRS